MRALGLTLAVLAAALAHLPATAGVIGRMTPAEPVTEARLAALPEPQRQQWLRYLARSRALMAADKAALDAERRGGKAPPPPGGSATQSMPLRRPAAWYATAEARRIADNIVSFQTPAGGWGKNQDRTGPPRLPGQSYVPSEKGWSYVGTIDNGATVAELRFLARVQKALPGASGDVYRAAFAKGVRYLLSAQYPNGGWPQVYPLQGGYHDALTFNDNAVANVIELLADAAARQGDYGFVPQALAAEARSAVGRAIDLVVASQVVIGGKRTAWGQQHDALTLKPVGARAYEPASLSSYESARLLELLMRQPNPSPAVVAAVHDGIAWLRACALHDVEWAPGATDAEGRRLTPRPGAGPIWARMYDLQTMRPIFGDRDGTIHDDIHDLIAERRNGYSWFGNAPARAIATYDGWSRRHGGQSDRR